AGPTGDRGAARPGPGHGRRRVDPPPGSAAHAGHRPARRRRHRTRHAQRPAAAAALLARERTPRGTADTRADAGVVVTVAARRRTRPVARPAARPAARGPEPEEEEGGDGAVSRLRPELDWMLEDLMATVPGTRQVMVLSGDGLRMAHRGAD